MRIKAINQKNARRGGPKQKTRPRKETNMKDQTTDVEISTVDDEAMDELAGGIDFLPIDTPKRKIRKPAKDFSTDSDNE